MGIQDKNVPHEAEQREVVRDGLKAGSDVGTIADVTAAAGANPTKAEYDALVVKFNKVLEVLRDSQLIPTT